MSLAKRIQELQHVVDNDEFEDSLQEQAQPQMVERSYEPRQVNLP